jgi:hypothetical protein
MPLGSHHVSHAQNNLNFLKRFYKGLQHKDWSITVSFYTAIHLIESAIYKTNKFNIQGKQLEFKGSGEAKQILIDNGIIKSTDKTSLHNIRAIIVSYAFQDIDGYYAGLQNMAWEARYIRFAWEQKDAYFATETYLKEILKWHNNNFATQFDTDFSKVPTDGFSAQTAPIQVKNSG